MTTPINAFNTFLWFVCNIMGRDKSKIYQNKFISNGYNYQ